MIEIIKKNKIKLAAAAAVLIILIIAFIAGGTGNKTQNSDTGYNVTMKNSEKPEKESDNININVDGGGMMSGIVADNSLAAVSAAPQMTPHNNAESSDAVSGENSESSSQNTSVSENAPSVGLSQAAGVNTDTVDEYQTETVPEGKPEPVEPQDVEITDHELKCYLTVSCETILNNMDRLKPEKAGLVPDDGIIYPRSEVVFYEGESVFNVLVREMKKNKIHLEYNDTPMYNSAYIEGINNLYEFDCGQNSGWMFMVNDWVPNYGVPRYEIKDGDDIVFMYTCDNGRDVAR